MEKVKGKQIRIPWVHSALALLLIVAALYLFLVDIPPVILTWETASEVGTAGFNIYRAEASSEEAFIQVNAALIPAEGDEVLGASYRYEDYAVSSATQYLYQIEEVEWDGTSQLFPETVTVRAGLTQTWRQIEGAILCIVAIVILWRGFKSHAK